MTNIQLTLTLEIQRLLTQHRSSKFLHSSPTPGGGGRAEGGVLASFASSRLQALIHLLPAWCWQKMKHRGAKKVWVFLCLTISCALVAVVSLVVVPPPLHVAAPPLRRTVIPNQHVARVAQQTPVDLLSAALLLGDAKNVDSNSAPSIAAYVPPSSIDEIDNFWGMVAGSAACLLVYIGAAFSFGSRIIIQKKCAVCGGSGLVTTSRTGRKLTAPRKCYACGGFLPWRSWGEFWKSNADVGNGGILRRPAADYDELNRRAREKQ